MDRRTRKTVYIIWVMIIFSAIVTTIDRWTGYIGVGGFALMLIFYGIYSIIPYKISKGSDGAKYAFLVLFVINLFATIGLGRGNMSTISFIWNLLTIPISIYVIYELFSAVKKLLTFKA